MSKNEVHFQTLGFFFQIHHSDHNHLNPKKMIKNLLAYIFLYFLDIFCIYFFIDKFINNFQYKLDAKNADVYSYLLSLCNQNMLKYI